MKKYIFFNVLVLLLSMNTSKNLNCMEPEESSSDSSYDDLPEVLKETPSATAGLSPSRHAASASCPTLPELQSFVREGEQTTLAPLVRRRIHSWQGLPGLGVLARRQQRSIFSKIRQGDVEGVKRWVTSSRDLNVRDSNGNTPMVEIGEQLVQAERQRMQAERREKALKDMLVELIRQERECSGTVDFSSKNKKGRSITDILRLAENPVYKEVAGDLELASRLTL
jgi:hypothetical protein